MNVGKNCNDHNEEDAKICAGCGKPAAMPSSITEEPKTYTFMKQKRVLVIGGSIGHKMTEVTIDGATMQIYRYTRLLLIKKYGESRGEVAISDITNVYMKKTLDKRMAWLLIIAAITAFVNGAISLAVIVVALFGLWDKLIFIETKQGVLKIPDVYTFTDELDKLIAHLQRINPAIKNGLVSTK